MNTTEIITALDAELSRLTQARAILMGESQRKPAARVTIMRDTSRPKRVMSPEGRARIVAAQKLRWAKSRKAA